jgi:hypothetical protein
LSDFQQFNEYYETWSNGPSTDASYFPIAVWLQEPDLAGQYKAIGVNLYIGLWDGPAQSQLDGLKSAGMQVICAQNQFALDNLDNYNDIIVGWMHGDEPDNAQWNSSTSSYDPCIDPDIIINDYNIWGMNDPTRPVYINFGRGAADTDWYGRGDCTGHTEMYPDYIQGADILSFDIYPVTNNIPSVAGDLTYVGHGIENLITWSGGTKAVWCWIETTHIDSDVKPTPAQVRSEVWMAIIHGANGIGYFCHDWNFNGTGTFNEHALLDDTQMRDAVAAINAEIAGLAAVITSQNRGNGIVVQSVSPSGSVDYLLKFSANALYIFTICMLNSTAGGTLNISGLQDPGRTVEVVGEGRSLTLANGVLSDTYGAYQVHIYRIQNI